MSLFSHSPKKIIRVARERLRRRAKAARQRAHYSPGGEKQVLFILGCQRSGTTMLSELYDLAPEVWMYGENDADIAREFRILPAEELRQVIAARPAPVLVFKPICDSQRADELLAEHPEARAVWLYRRYQDVANSATTKWNEHQVDLIRRIVDNEYASLKWRGERLDEEARELARRLYRPDMQPAAGAALFWYIRNRFYYTLGLDRDDRVMLQQYEDLVQHPERCLPRLFAHAGAAYDSRYAAPVRTSSIGLREFPEIEPEIRALCDDMLARLDADYQAALADEPVAAD